MTPPTPLPPTDTAITAALQPHDLTPSEFHTLRAHAAAAKARAYCPYSNFRVGAALLARPAGDDDGADDDKAAAGAAAAAAAVVVTGANVENASYPVGTCAERVALGRAVVEGHRRFRAVAVATDGAGPASPCGMCRQFIREFCDLSTPIIMFDKDSNFIVMKLEELLPMSFGPDNLGAPDPAKPPGAAQP